MEQGPLGLTPELRTPPLPATHVRVGTGHRVLARNYTTDQGRPSYVRVHSLRATSCRNFRCAFTPPLAFRVSVEDTRSVRPARWASAIVGARPAHDTRLGSSKVAEMAGKL